jgi:hypothetical protein
MTEVHHSASLARLQTPANLRYPIGRLIVAEMVAKQISRAELARRIGYTNTTKAQRRLNEVLQQGYRSGIVERIAGALEIEPGKLRDATKQTQMEQDFERRAAGCHDAWRWVVPPERPLSKRFTTEVMFGEREILNVPSFALGHYRPTFTDLSSEVDWHVAQGTKEWLDTHCRGRWKFEGRRHRPRHVKSSEVYRVFCFEHGKDAARFAEQFGDRFILERIRFWWTEQRKLEEGLDDSLRLGVYALPRLRQGQKKRLRMFRRELREIVAVRRRIDELVAMLRQTACGTGYCDKVP